MKLTVHYHSGKPYTLKNVLDFREIDGELEVETMNLIDGFIYSTTTFCIPLQHISYATVRSNGIENIIYKSRKTVVKLVA